MLAAVAYLYVLGDALPKLEYLTLMDQYVYACIIYIIMLIVQCCLISWLKLDGKMNAWLILDAVVLVLIVVIYCIQRCRLDSRRNKMLETYPFSKYKSGLMALVQYDVKKNSISNVAKVTADEYAHQVMKKEYFEVPVAKDWAE